MASQGEGAEQLGGGVWSWEGLQGSSLPRSTLTDGKTEAPPPPAPRRRLGGAAGGWGGGGGQGRPEAGLCPPHTEPALRKTVQLTPNQAFSLRSG